MKVKKYESWGRYPQAKHTQIVAIKGPDVTIPSERYPRPVLAFGQGRSYGDSCLNDGGILLDTESLSKIISFDKKRGLLRCEAGTTLAEILKLIVPRGWFLPVTPGTKYVSVGGAIANDIHGKNHHRAGSFGCFVTQFELLRSSGERVICSPTQNVELYRATIGGLGLTGLILWAEFQLKPVASPLIAFERIPFTNLEEFYSLSADSDKDYEYTVAWLDSGSWGRGIFLRGNSAGHDLTDGKTRGQGPMVSLPFHAPNWLLNAFTSKTMNEFYYYLQSRGPKSGLLHYEPFFYPLDAVLNWNRIYGKRGFFQYQCVIPFERREAIDEILNRTERAGEPAVLAVLKTFGDVKSPGMLSFPRPGVTLAVDFPNRGERTLRLLEELDEVTRSARGAVYPAKDARMSAKSFQTYFPEWRAFQRFVDPRFSSSFWRRVARPE
ncbi:MAG: FAD-binding oxidoreductase [Pyrinomonadaceae bacterium]